MYKNIKYKGISVNTSDYECPDGELTDTIGMESVELGLHVPVTPTDITSIDVANGEKILFIHKTTGYTHHILQKGNDLYWMDKVGGVYVKTLLRPDVVAKDISTVGNTLVILTEEGLLYALWKQDAYQWLGKMPEYDMEFCLECRIEQEKIGVVHIKADAGNNNLFVLGDGEEQKIFAKVNKVIADNSINKGRFIFPFLVRYAYRLFDGSLAMHSAPVLMQCSDLVSPCICGDNWQNDGSPMDLTAFVASHKLFYREMNATILSDWEDIIKSVDVFISAPIYTYNQAGKLVVAQPMTKDGSPEVRSTAQIPFASKSISVCRMDGAGIHPANRMQDGLENPLTRYIQPRTFRDMYCLTYVDMTDLNIYQNDEFKRRAFLEGMEEAVKVPSFPREKVMKKIADTHNFYLLKSLPTSELNKDARADNLFRDMKVPEDYLQSLTSREVMTDAFDARADLIPRTLYNYNGRLNIANVTKSLYNGYRPKFAIQTTDGYCHRSADNAGHILLAYPPGMNYDKKIKGQMKIYVYIRKDGKEFVVKSDQAEVFNRGWYSPIFYFYYPDKNAYKAIVAVSDEQHGNPKYYQLNLTPSDFLNGSIFCDTPSLERDAFPYYDLLDYKKDKFAQDQWDKWCEVAPLNGNELSPELQVRPVVTEKLVSLPNKIYTSPTYNPFVFPLEGINSVGSGEIIGLAAATKALSEGQFGQFPLYAFTTEGVWALELTSIGSFSSVQPVTRDVCVSEKSITPADNSILFLTRRGLMMLTGGNAICISDRLKENSFVYYSSLPSYLKILEGMTLKSSDTPFIDYIDKEGADNDAGIIYDYLNRRIIVYNPLHDYAYVYNVDTETWGKMSCNVLYHLNSYPDALAVINGDQGGMLADFSTKLGMADDMSAHKCSFFTRPIKFEQPDMYKTIRSVIQNGRFDAKKVNQILYGSNDLIKWFPVRSSDNARMTGFSGTPYKFFVIAVTASLNNKEYIQGCNIEYEPKLTNKLR